DTLQMRLVLLRERRLLRGQRDALRRRRERAARPEPFDVVAMAAHGREPAAIVRDDALLLGLRIVERQKADADLRAVRDSLQRPLELVEIANARAADLSDQTGARNRRGAEHVTGVRHVDP